MKIVSSTSLLARSALVVALGLAAVSFAAADDPPAAPADRARLAKATFAGGCFWCMEPPFDALVGVVATTSGYAGGHEPDPTYQEVSAGKSGHAEVVQVLYDPDQIPFEELLRVFWRNIDPTVPDRQFCDWGHQYRTAVFYHDEEQRRLAEESKIRLEEAGRLPGPIVTEIVPLERFFPAEEYHQDFYEKAPAHYKRYRVGCGRDARLRQLWSDEAGGP